MNKKWKVYFNDGTKPRESYANSAQEAAEFYGTYGYYAIVKVERING